MEIEIKIRKRKTNFFVVMLSCFILFFALIIGSQCTPLDDYVNAPDPTYNYTLAGKH